MKFMTWSIGRKLTAGFAAVIILTIAVGATGLFALNMVRTEVSSTTTTSARLETLSSLIYTSLLEARRSEKDFFLRYKDNGIDEAKALYVTQVQTQVATIHQYAVEGAGLVADKVAQARFSQIEKLADAYETSFLQAVALQEQRGYVDTGLEGQFRAKIHEMEDAAAEANLDRLTIDILTIRRHEKDYLLRGDPEYIDQVVQQVAQFKQDLAAADLSQADKTRLGTLADEYLALFRQLTTVDTDLTAAIEQYREDAHNIEPVTDEIKLAADQDFQASVSRTNETIRWANIGEILALALAALVGFGIAFFLARSISRPVGRLTEATRKLASGDLTQKVEIRSQDEIGVMADAFGQMILNLRDLIGQVTDTANTVGLASGQLSTAAEQAGQATQQVAGTIQQIAQGTTQQTQAVTEAANNVTQMARASEGIARGAQEQAQGITKTSDLTLDMAAIVTQVGQTARSVSEANAKVTQAARSGVSTVGQTSQGMDAIRTRTLAAAEKIKDMGHRSKEIGRIVETIDDIADKTDMLALNAAVEAARAGEYGRGFAVVADQVRKLSEDSKAATRDIGDLIERVQGTIHEAITAMDSATMEVDNGVRLTGDTTRSLGEILQAAENAAGLAEQIATAVNQLKQKSEGVVAAMETVTAVVEENTAVAEEMAASSQEVTQAMEGVAGVAEENSAAAEEVSASAEEMSAQVEEVVASAQELSSLAEQLRAAVAQFQLEESSPPQHHQPVNISTRQPQPKPEPERVLAGHHGNGYRN